MSQHPDPEESDALLEQVLLELGPLRASVTGRDRLLSVVQALPLRFAPFFTRLGALWALSEAEVEAQLAESAKRPWPRVWKGIRYYTVTPGPSLGVAKARLLRFDPGVRFPTHRHDGEEEVMVLEGSYTDSDGRLVSAGDTQRMPGGSEHALIVSADSVCTAAIVQRGLSFAAPLVDRVKRFVGI